MTDVELLDKLLADDRLSDMERDAFDGMRERLRVHAFGDADLSPRQRAWADGVYRKLELDAEEGAANLVSSGKMRVDPSERRRVFGYEQLPRPLKPPGRQ